MRKLMLLMFVGFFLISFCSAYNFTIMTDYDACGSKCKVIRFDEPDEMQFRKWMLTSGGECTPLMNSTISNYNYTTTFIMDCHLYYNNSFDTLQWDNMALIWNGNSTNLNFTNGLFMYQNASQIEFYKVFFSAMSDTRNMVMITPARALNITSSTESNYDFAPQYIAEKDLNTDVHQTLESTTMMMMNTNFSGFPDNDKTTLVLSNHFLNASMYFTSWYDTMHGTYILLEPGQWKVTMSILNSSVHIVRSKNDGFYSMVQSKITNYMHDTKEGTLGMCMVSSQAVISNNTIEGAKLWCPEIGFAYAANFKNDFLDSEKVMGSWRVASFWGTADVYVRYTLDYLFRDRFNDPVTATYKIFDKEGKEYTGTTDHMQQIVDSERHQGAADGTYTYTNFRPFNISFNTSNDLMDIVNYSANITFKHKGSWYFDRADFERIHLTKDGGTLHLK